MKISKSLKSLEGKTLIITHHNADLDAVSSMIGLHLGLKEIGIKSDMGVAESISRISKPMANDYSIKIDPDCSKYDNIIIVDTSNSDQLKGIKNLRADFIIDHHIKGNLTENTKESFINERAKSASQMVFIVLDEMGFKIDKKIGKILLSGIIADTGHLKLADAETLKIVVRLLETGIELRDVIESISFEPDISESIASLKAARNLDLYKSEKLIITFSKGVSHEASSCRALLRIGADIAIVASIKKKEVRISSRAKNKILDMGLDLSVIFKEVGKIIGGNGGGHDLAGSANGTSTDNVNEAFRFILSEISKKAGKFKKI